MTKRSLATFVFEHETVLGDLFELMRDYSSKIDNINYPGKGSELWEMTLSFPGPEEIKGFAKELGRDPI